MIVHINDVTTVLLVSAKQEALYCCRTFVNMNGSDWDLQTWTNWLFQVASCSTEFEGALTTDALEEGLKHCPIEAAFVTPKDISRRPLLYTVLLQTVPNVTIVRWLIKHRPDMARERFGRRCDDHEDPNGANNLSPLELLSLSILARTEMLRYSKGKAEVDKETIINALENLWACVSILARPLSPRYAKSDSLVPTLHTCVAAIVDASKDFPYALFSFALDRFPEQFTLPDDRGSVPLHLVATLPNKGPWDLDVMEAVLQRNEKAKTITNSKGFYPFDLFLQSWKKEQKTKDNDLDQEQASALLWRLAHPTAQSWRQRSTFSSYILFRLLDGAQPNAIFCLLQQNVADITESSVGSIE